MLQLRDLELTFDDKCVLHDINIDVSDGEILCLLGPSGCGKTSLLRSIAGLETLNHGEIIIHGENITTTPTHLRRFGLMFQDYALFPHMTVAENVIFGLKMDGVAPVDRKKRLRELLQLVGLSSFEDRDVALLSGGEKQRVALARSLAPSPRLLMLDEPLGALDTTLRQRLIVELRSIIKQLGLTAIYVTHDQQEAFAIADRIAIMNAGKIVQLDNPQTIYQQPKTVFVATFLDLGNLVVVKQYADGYLMTDIGKFPASKPSDFILIHPQGISIQRHEPSASDIQGLVIQCVYLGEQYLISVACGNDIELKFKINSIGNVIPDVGQSLRLKISNDNVVPLLEN